jgi:hypothetical protein
MSPEDIHAAAGAHHELGRDYSDAVVASFLEKVDREIAARVDERLAAGAPRRRPVQPGNRRAVAKGFAMGVAVSLGFVLLFAASRAGHHALALIPLLALAFAAGARWASRHWTIRRATPPQAPRPTGDGDYRRWT